MLSPYIFLPSLLLNRLLIGTVTLFFLNLKHNLIQSIRQLINRLFTTGLYRLGILIDKGLIVLMIEGF